MGGRSQLPGGARGKRRCLTTTASLAACWPRSIAGADLARSRPRSNLACGCRCHTSYDVLGRRLVFGMTMHEQMDYSDYRRVGASREALLAISREHPPQTVEDVKTQRQRAGLPLASGNRLQFALVELQLHAHQPLVMKIFGAKPRLRVDLRSAAVQIPRASCRPSCSPEFAAWRRWWRLPRRVASCSAPCRVRQAKLCKER